MITVSRAAAKRLANPRCRVCKGRGYIGQTGDNLLIGCKCVLIGVRRQKKQKPRVVQPDSHRHD